MHGANAVKHTAFDTALKIYDLCGIDGASVPGSVTVNIQMIADRFLPLDYVYDVVRMMNMVNSEYIQHLECVAKYLNPYWGLYL